MLEPSPIPTHAVSMPSLEARNIRLLVKRLDLIHPSISGNKFFKLKYNMQEAKRLQVEKVLTFGGAYSNHISATAEAAKLVGLKSIGIIRGEKPTRLNPTLVQAQDAGMLLHYISRERYRQKTAASFLQELQAQFGDFQLIPEGGTNALAIKGTREILQGKDLEADIIACSMGTGGTFAGVVASANPHQEVWGFSALKGNFMEKEIRQLMERHHIQPQAAYRIFEDYHFGGYAKHRPELLEFIQGFYDAFGIPLDPIYTGKMLYGVLDASKVLQDKTILCLHTGGLQGISGFNERFGTNLRDR